MPTIKKYLTQEQIQKKIKDYGRTSRCCFYSMIGGFLITLSSFSYNLGDTTSNESFSSYRERTNSHPIVLLSGGLLNQLSFLGFIISRDKKKNYTIKNLERRIK